MNALEKCPHYWLGIAEPVIDDTGKDHSRKEQGCGAEEVDERADQRWSEKTNEERQRKRKEEGLCKRPSLLD